MSTGNKRRRRRHKTKWNYKRIAAAVSGFVLIITAAVVLLVSAKGGEQPNNLSKNNGSTSPQDNKTTLPQSQPDYTEGVPVNADNKGVQEQTENNNDNAVKKTSKGYTITEENGITYVDGVMIVNKTYAVPKDYNPGAVTAEVMEAFNVMQNAAKKEGLNIYISSGFRSYETQDRLYNNYVAQDGKEEADRYSARPGHSEHQTGLCFDLNSIDDSFAATPEGKWVAEHAWEYGFIIRYPKGKEDITGYMYESWHLRYLGKELAKKLYDSGLTLEEYYGITSKYGE